MYNQQIQQQNDSVRYGCNHHHHFEANNLAFLNGDNNINDGNNIIPQQQYLSLPPSRIQQHLQFSPQLQQPHQMQQYLYTNSDNNNYVSSDLINLTNRSYASNKPALFRNGTNHQLFEKSKSVKNTF
ncbi:7214_t:CDS:2 [Entrophospora sp. SA101]|nr:14690_t:CDS:2 [Entrophospora sp. SA101]CAJ0636538.1 7214_t:CDS:2 [Entrophospora sp. SA101]CAJ0824221.1 11690_t:CDS:2 [Entrophospora sp. SA101]CAJ0828969.1 9078_t:CDS:2 [Entrophospora sp. SA101]